MRPLGVFCEPVQLALPQPNKQTEPKRIKGQSWRSRSFQLHFRQKWWSPDFCGLEPLALCHMGWEVCCVWQVTTNIAQLPRQSDGGSQFHSWKPCVSAQTCWNHRFAYVCLCMWHVQRGEKTNPVFQKLYGHTSSIVKSPGPGRLCRQWHTDVEAKLQCASPDISCTGILRRASAMNLTLLISLGHWHLKPVIFGCLVRVPLCSNVREIFLGPRVVNIWFHNITWRPSQAWYPFTSLYGLTARSTWGSWATDISYATPRIYSFWALGPKHELHANQ